MYVDLLEIMLECVERKTRTLRNYVGSEMTSFCNDVIWNYFCFNENYVQATQRVRHGVSEIVETNHSFFRTHYCSCFLVGSRRALKAHPLTNRFHRQPFWTLFVENVCLITSYGSTARHKNINLLLEMNDTGSDQDLSYVKFIAVKTW